MADFETNPLQSVTPEQLRREVLDPDEIAVVDVREGDRYASGHISVAVELPFSEIELRVAPLLRPAPGRPGCDLDALVQVTIRVGELALDLGEALLAFELNPVIAGTAGNGVTAVDALIELTPPG